MAGPSGGFELKRERQYIKITAFESDCELLPDQAVGGSKLLWFSIGWHTSGAHPFASMGVEDRTLVLGYPLLQIHRISNGIRGKL